MKGLDVRLRAVELLRLAKRFYTYRELEELTGIHPSTLSRYVSGQALPGPKRAEELCRLLGDAIIKRDDIFHPITKFDRNGFLDNTSLLFDDLHRKLFATWVREEASRMRKKPSKILTAAVDGIPLATTVADILALPLVVAKKEREVGVSSFWSTTVARPDGSTLTLFAPKGWLRRKDRLLIIDDVARDGTTLSALVKLARAAGAPIYGIFIAIGIGDWRSSLPDDLYCPVEAMVEVRKCASGAWQTTYAITR